MTSRLPDTSDFFAFIRPLVPRPKFTSPSWNNSISPEFHPATKPLTVEPVDSGNEIVSKATSLCPGSSRLFDDEKTQSPATCAKCLNS